MSCITSEEDLKERQACAIKNNWGFIPVNKRIDAWCPYCDVALAFEYDYEGASEYEEECPSCGKTFNLFIEFEPVYSCERKKEADE